MKTNIRQLLAILAIAASLTSHAFAHAKTPKAGPNGGRVIQTVEPHLEFLVTKDRKVEITPLTEDLKPGKLSGQIISITAGERTNPTKLELEEKDGKLVSVNALPEGGNVPVSVSIKAGAGSKAVYEKFHLNLATCPGCTYPEYACICDHAAEKK